MFEDFDKSQEETGFPLLYKENVSRDYSIFSIELTSTSYVIRWNATWKTLDPVH